MPKFAANVISSSLTALVPLTNSQVEKRLYSLKEKILMVITKRTLKKFSGKFFFDPTYCSKPVLFLQ